MLFNGPRNSKAWPPRDRAPVALLHLIGGERKGTAVDGRKEGVLECEGVKAREPDGAALRLCLTWFRSLL